MATPTCIDLKAAFGSRYRITADESATPRNSDPWLWRIPCRRGCHIFPWGGDRLGVVVDHCRGVARQVAAIPGVREEQYGDQERTYSFPAGLFDQVAAVMRPRQRRKLSEAQRAALAERGRAALQRFRQGNVREGANAPQTCDPAPR